MPQAAPIPQELFRLATLYDYKILDTGHDDTIEKLLRCAKLVMQTSFAAVSLVDVDRYWFKASAGIDHSEAPREVSFCDHGLCSNAPMIVPDTRADSRFFDNPLVLNGSIGSYCGAPLVAPNGMQLGMLCVAQSASGIVPSAEQVACLTDLASLVMRELETHRLGRIAQDSAVSSSTEINRLQAVRVRLEEVLEARARFFATLSHDLRTPLHGILGFSNLIRQRPADSASVANFATQLHAAGERMQESINDTLQIAVGWKGNRRATPRPTEIQTVVAQVVRFTEAFASKQGVCVKTAIDEAGWRVMADRDALKHALLQLYINAITACPKGGSVTCSVERSALGMMQINVFNTGTPMSAIAAARALTPLGQPCVAGGDGTGVRLPITRLTIEQLGGTISLRGDEQRGGTVATLTLQAVPDIIQASQAA